jgi:Tfp pilus assembly protein PilF
MKYRSVLQSALQLARDGKSEQALILLDQALGEPEVLAHPTEFVVLARNAGILAEHVGDLRRAEAYYAKALNSCPTDPTLMLALSHIYRSLGDSTRAKSYFDQCAQASQAQNNGDLSTLIQELKKRGTM